MAPPNDIAGIVAEANTVLDDLRAVERDLENRIRANPPNRQSLREAQTAVREAKVQVSIVAMEAIDSSETVTRLIADLTITNQGLEEARTKVQNIVEITAKISQITAAIASVAAGLASLAI